MAAQTSSATLRLIAELGDLSRFANPRQLMAYLGLVPSEHSRGPISALRLLSVSGADSIQEVGQGQ